MEGPKILVGCVTYDGHKRHIEVLVNNIRSLGRDAIIVDNSEGEEYSVELKSRGLTILRDPPQGKNRIQRIISGRNIVRKYFLERDYDYLLFIDTDIVLPKNVIESLLKCSSDIASGVYLCNQQIKGKMEILPAIYSAGSDENSARTIKVSEVIPNRILDIKICGLGCALIKREVLEEIEFRHFTDSDEGGEDVAFCLDAKKHGFKIKANTEVKCEHKVKLAGKNVVLAMKN